ncbi:hypothetical protein BCR33DRAFT_782803 [Rhizoclosmatium globosum]|uniref:Cyclic nucleotide-binding domain-containing protein n=1 Tax=Rhizoclosmatium globosum TaxID=329046 RepID=A0A1Y2CL12_9FUNG|nr:hypothetical protein BCR33DRAFT_782803 [Rhizoclosmatium globosum]|eukprot:ORY47712.1 hypothetical protein BCR33DRAFT_782803 [Rhizoclosmatium globosum]
MPHQQKFRELKYHLLQKIESLKSEFIAKTDELMNIVIFLDPFTSGNQNDESSQLARSFDFGSHLELGVRFTAEDYTAAMSGNKTKRSSIYSEKRTQAHHKEKGPQELGQLISNDAFDESDSQIALHRKNTNTSVHSSPKPIRTKLYGGGDLLSVSTFSVASGMLRRKSSNGSTFSTSSGITEKPRKFQTTNKPRQQSLFGNAAFDQFATITQSKDEDESGPPPPKKGISSSKARWGAIKATVQLKSVARNAKGLRESTVSAPETPVNKPASEFDKSKEVSITVEPADPVVSGNEEEARLSRNQRVSFQSTSTSPATRNFPLQRDAEDRKSNARKSAKDEFQNQYFALWFLLPAYDNKGRLLNLEQFDRSDFDDATFRLCGFHPRSVFISYWDFTMAGIYACALWLIPFSICYQSTRWDLFPSPSVPSTFTTTISVIYTIIFALDSTISALTPHPVSVYAMCSFRDYEISRQSLPVWLRTWFKQDFVYHFLSVIPFDLIFLSFDCSPFLQLFRVLRLVTALPRVFKCAMIKRMKSNAEAIVGTGVAQIFPICIMIAFVIHWNACLMYLFGKWAGFVGWEKAWDDFQNASIGGFYAWTFYQTMGNMLPMSFMFHTVIEQVLGVCSMVVGSIMFATLIGAISAATLSYDTSGRLYNEKMDELVDYMKWKNFSDETKDRLISYYETKYRGKYFEEENLLANMNESLRTEVSLHNTRKLIEQVPFLRRQENDGRDFITKQGDSGLDMFFILQGKVNVLVNDTKVVSLYDGSYIGEVALITKSLRTASVQAALPSVLYRLTCDDFNKILTDFIDMKMRVEALAKIKNG